MLSYLLITDTFKIKNIFILVISLIPFLTLSLGLKIFLENQPEQAAVFISSVFGNYGGSFLIFLVFILELMGLVRIARLFSKPEYKSLGEKKLLTYKPETELKEQTEESPNEEPGESPEPDDNHETGRGLRLRFVSAREMALKMKENTEENSEETDERRQGTDSDFPLTFLKSKSFRNFPQSG